MDCFNKRNFSKLV